MPPILHVLALLALVAAPVASAKPVDVQTTGDAKGDIAAVTLLGDADGGVVGASLLGDVHGGTLAVSLLGDVEGDGVAVSYMGTAYAGLALSVNRGYCSEWFRPTGRNTLTCDDNGLSNTSEWELAHVALDVAGSGVKDKDVSARDWSVDRIPPPCDPYATIRITAASEGVGCGTGCEQRVILVLAILGDSEACNGEHCSQNVAIVGAIGGNAEACNTEDPASRLRGVVAG